MKERITYIYKLVDPREPEVVRYVGKSNDPFSRLKDHIKEAKAGKRKSYKNNWILKLLSEGVRPEFVILEPVFYKYHEEWEFFERFWIKHYREQKHPITNYVEGGEGNKGWKPSLETRQKISKTLTGRKLSPEQVRAISEGHKGITYGPMPEEQRKAISERMKGQPGRPHTEETKRKISAANKGKVKRKSDKPRKYTKPVVTKEMQQLRISSNILKTIEKCENGEVFGVAKAGKGWQAVITVDGVSTYLGFSLNYDEAVSMRREAEKKYFKYLKEKHTEIINSIKKAA